MKARATRHVIYTIALALSVSACTIRSDVPEQSLNVSQVGNSDTLDNQFAKVAKQVPEFAGFYYGDNGEPTVAVSGEADVPATINALTDLFGKDVFNRQFSPAEVTKALSNRGHVLVPVERDPKFVKVSYSFAELRDIYEKVGAVVWKQPGVSSLDLDEVRNRVVIGVAKGGVTAVADELAALKLPKDSYLVEVAPLPREQQTLRNRHRPLMGGLQINYSGFACTLGFNAVRNGVRGFVTNSHCTADQSRVTGTMYGQTTGAAVGVEVAEAALFPCIVGSQCRWADAAFARYLTQDNSLGAVAPVAPGSLNIFTAIGQDDIVRTSEPLSGETLTKIGRTTGATSGTVTQTCVTQRALGSSIVNLCQDRASSNLPVATNPISQQGDSGSPVLEFVGTFGSKYLFELKGLHWGGWTSVGINDHIFSPMSGVLAALGSLETVAPEATFSVQVDIQSITAVGSFGETPDFYANVIVGDRRIQGRTVESRVVSPYQVFTFAGEGAENIPIRLEVWDEDSGFRGRDDSVDINPGSSEVLEFTLNTRTGTLTGDITSRTGRTINVAGTPDEAASMSFTVNVIR